MAKILIVYATDYGNTEKMAKGVLEGVNTVVDTIGILKKAEDVIIDEVQSCDGLILGSPVHMGSPDWRVKQFIDKVCSKLWMKDALIGKVGAVFASGGGFGSAGGGGELTMLALLNNLVELGMIIVPLPKNTPGYPYGGLQWGPYGRSMGENMEQTGIAEKSIEAARYHGANVARLAAIVKDKHVFAKPAHASH